MVPPLDVQILTIAHVNFQGLGTKDIRHCKAGFTASGWTPQNQDGRPIVRYSKLLQPPLHFLDKICTPRLLWTSLSNLALKLRNICRDSLILLIRFQCFKIAFATAKPNCCVISILQPLVSTQLSSSYQIIKPFCLDSEICLHWPICFHEQRTKLVGLDIKMGPVTCCSVRSTTTAGLAIATAAYSLHVISRAVWFHQTNQTLSYIEKCLQQLASVSCTSLAAHGYGLCPHLHSAATPPWLQKTERHGKHRQIAGCAIPKMQPFRVRIFRCANVPSEKKRGSSQCERCWLSI